MPLTKTQKTELKKIDASYTRIEKMSLREGFSLDNYVPDPDLRFPLNGDLHKRKVNEQSRKRQQLFEQAKQHKAKAF